MTCVSVNPRQVTVSMNGARGRQGDKGDPGGNAAAVGLWNDISALAIPDGYDRIYTSGFAVTGRGAAAYVLDSDQTDTAPSLARRKSLAGTGATARWFRLDEAQAYPEALGAVGNGSTDDTAAFAALAALGQKIVVQRAYAIASSVTLGKVEFGAAGQLIVGAAATVTIGEIVDTRRVGVFDTTSGGLVAFASTQSFARPEWWGDVRDTITKAAVSLAAARAAGGAQIKLAIRRYKGCNHSYGTGINPGVYFSYENMAIEGEKMPRPANDCRSLIGGSIIEDFFLVFAYNISCSNFGVDCGKTYIDANYGGTARDAFMATYPSDADKAVPEIRLSGHFSNIIGLVKGPSDPVHAVIIAEGYKNVVGDGEIQGFYGIHGVVIKAENVRLCTVSAYCNALNGLIMKSDSQATAVAANIQIDKVLTFAGGPLGWSPYAVSTSGNGVLFNPEANPSDRIWIGSILEEGHDYGVSCDVTSGQSLGGVQIDSIKTDGNAVAGVSIETAAGAFIESFQIGKCETRNTVLGMVIDIAAGTGVQVDSLIGTNCDVALQVNGSTSRISARSVTGANCVDAVIRITDSAKPEIGEVRPMGTTPALYAASSGGEVAAFTNGAVQAAGGGTVQPRHVGGGRVAWDGLVNPDASPDLLSVPPWARPLADQRLLAQGYDGAALTEVPVLVTAAGVLKVNEVGGGVANCSTWLSLSGVSYPIAP